MDSIQFAVANAAQGQADFDVSVPAAGHHRFAGVKLGLFGIGKPIDLAEHTDGGHGSVRGRHDG
ncbi:MAG: hypothetical protein U0361_24900 [Nitrospiraceae bacterium]